MINLPENKKLILFDGVCNLCNTSVIYVIKRDKKNQFLFAPLQSNIGKQITEKYKIDSKKIDSIILYVPEKGIDYKSTAALKIASKINFPTNLLIIFIIVPAFVRNWIYDVIARNRYQWFGKKNTCMIPAPHLRNKFLN